MLHNPIKLRKLLKDRIIKTGPVTFREFMKESLYNQDFGYYSQIDFPGGKHGDFVTAPHASLFFGSLLSVQISEFFEKLDNKECNICEFGAGAGYLAQDIMRYFRKHEPKLFQKLKYFVVEPLKKRRKVLQDRLSEFKDHFEIIEKFSECGRFSGVIVANELLDAFPVHLVEKKGGKFKEVYIGLDREERFLEILRKPSTSELAGYLDQLNDLLPDGYRTEVNLDIKDWIMEISGAMVEGFVLTIDYGFSSREYFAPHRNRGTLLGYSGQRTTEDFFSFPGMVDITAHVNFSDLLRWGEEQGMKCMGFTPQWAFLGGLDPDETMQKVFGKVDPFSPILAGIKALIFPQAMGETHKAMVLSKGLDNIGSLKGFKIRDYKETLK